MTIQQRIAHLKQQTSAPEFELLEAARQMPAAGPEPYELLKDIPKICVSIQAADHVVLLRANQDEDNLSVKAEYSAAPTQIILSSTVLEAVLTTGETFFSTNVAEDERLAGSESVAAFDVKTVAAARAPGGPERYHRRAVCSFVQPGAAAQCRPAASPGQPGRRGY